MVNVNTIKGYLVVVMCCWMTFSSQATYEWTHVSTSDRLGGRMISAGYLRGKIVLFDRRDYTDSSKENCDDIRQLQTIWATYKTKCFILLGSHSGKKDPKKVAEVMAKCGVTYPVYADAWLSKVNPTEHEISVDAEMRADTKARVTVVDSTCQKKLYRGRDLHQVSGVVGSALMGISTPMTPKQYQFLLDYELKMLPGRAYLRLNEYRKQFPNEARSYDSVWEKLSNDEDVKKLAKLSELSRLVKDRNMADNAARRLTPSILEKTISKFEPLKQHANPIYAQEAKNALADIKWSAATIQK